MKGSIETTTTVKLELTKEEAEWLKGLMQNPHNGRMPQDEPDFDKNMRMLFWNILNRDPKPASGIPSALKSL